MTLQNYILSAIKAGYIDLESLATRVGLTKQGVFRELYNLTNKGLVEPNSVKTNWVLTQQGIQILKGAI